jgi:ParB family transcriptional regulator, chromosome partitioning protein
MSDTSPDTIIIEPHHLFDLPLDQVTVPKNRARDLDPVWARALAGLVQAQGLTNPITVRHIEDHYELVTGLHRLEAFRLLRADDIPARLSSAQTDDEARLEEVMENLGRNELIALDRCHHLYELKQVYERMYPETRAGLAGANARYGVANEMFSFAKTTAEKIGLSGRAIQIAVSIWSKLTPETRAALRGTRIATKQSELKLLAAQDTRMQQRIMDLIGLPDTTVDSVQGALDAMDRGNAVSDVERKFSTFRKVFTDLEDSQLDRIIGENSTRIIAGLKRLGLG